VELKVCLLTKAYFHSVWLCKVRLVISDGSFISVACMCLTFFFKDLWFTPIIKVGTPVCLWNIHCVVCSNTACFGPIRLNILCIAELRGCRVGPHCHNCTLNYIRSCWSVGPVPCSTGRWFVPEGNGLSFTVRDFQDTWLIPLWTCCGVRLCKLQ
jgi:hypothetical protein